MRRIVLLATALAAAALAIPAVAGAHNTTWYWSETLAANRLKVLDVVFDADGGVRDVTKAKCAARDKNDYILNDAGTQRLYKHFNCAFLVRNGAVWTGVLHVTGKKKFVMTNLKLYAGSNGILQ